MRLVKINPLLWVNVEGDGPLAVGWNEQEPYVEIDTMDGPKQYPAETVDHGDLTTAEKAELVRTVVALLQPRPSGYPYPTLLGTVWTGREETPTDDSKVERARALAEQWQTFVAGNGPAATTYRQCAEQLLALLDGPGR